MSTVIQFTPSTAGAFQFKPTIGNTLYTAFVTLNLFGGRYFLNLYDQSSTLVISRALTSTGPKLQATLTWEDTGIGGLATIETATPHNVPLGQLANVYVSQTGTSFDGKWQALSVSETELTYALNNPDFVQPLPGSVSFPLNLVETANLGGFLLWDYSASTFEWQ